LVFLLFAKIRNTNRFKGKEDHLLACANPVIECDRGRAPHRSMRLHQGGVSSLAHKQGRSGSSNEGRCEGGLIRKQEIESRPWTAMNNSIVEGAKYSVVDFVVEDLIT
jgi:hypothetical protein